MLQSEGVANTDLKAQELSALESRTAWARPVILLAALLTSLWLVYRALTQGGVWVAVLVFIGLSIAFNFGPAPMFAAAASALCFYLKAIGIWLPLLSYAVAIASLAVDLRRESLRKCLDTYGRGSSNGA
jgi:hypothetical protein